MPVTITASDLKLFMACKRAWAWNQADYRLPEARTGNMALGTRVHAALEHYYKTGLDPLVEHERLFRNDLADVSGWEEDQLFADVIVGRKLVQGFLDWLTEEGADDDYTVEAVEHQIEAPFLDGKVLLRGKIDTLFRRKDNGFLVISDTKTSGKRGAHVRAALERSWQHTVYAIALSILRPDEHIAGSYYTMLYKSGHPIVERFRVPGSTVLRPHTVDQLTAICTEMLDVPDPLSPKAYPCPSEHCHWCEYRQPCEIAADSLEAAQSRLNADYRSGGGRLRRYDPL